MSQERSRAELKAEKDAEEEKVRAHFFALLDFVLEKSFEKDIEKKIPHFYVYFQKLLDRRSTGFVRSPAPQGMSRIAQINAEIREELGDDLFNEFQANLEAILRKMKESAEEQKKADGKAAPEMMRLQKGLKVFEPPKKKTVYFHPLLEKEKPGRFKLLKTQYCLGLIPLENGQLLYRNREKAHRKITFKFLNYDLANVSARTEEIKPLCTVDPDGIARGTACVSGDHLYNVNENEDQRQKMLYIYEIGQRNIVSKDKILLFDESDEALARFGRIGIYQLHSIGDDLLMGAFYSYQLQVRKLFIFNHATNKVLLFNIMEQTEQADTVEPQDFCPITVRGVLKVLIGTRDRGLQMMDLPLPLESKASDPRIQEKPGKSKPLTSPCEVEHLEVSRDQKRVLAVVGDEEAPMLKIFELDESASTLTEIYCAPHLPYHSDQALFNVDGSVIHLDPDSQLVRVAVAPGQKPQETVMMTPVEAGSRRQLCCFPDGRLFITNDFGECILFPAPIYCKIYSQIESLLAQREMVEGLPPSLPYKVVRVTHPFYDGSSLPKKEPDKTRDRILDVIEILKLVVSSDPASAEQKVLRVLQDSIKNMTSFYQSCVNAMKEPAFKEVNPDFHNFIERLADLFHRLEPEPAPTARPSPSSP